MDASIILDRGWRSIREVEEYLAGLIIGDGHIDNPDKYGHYRLRIFDNAKGFLEKLSSNIFLRHYKLKPSIYWEGSCWCISIYGKEFIKYIEDLIDKNKNRCSLDFIRGFFDAEGSIYIGVRKKNKAYLNISLTSKNPEILARIKKTLEKHDIKSTIATNVYLDKRTRKIYSKYRLIIRRKIDVSRFINLIGIRNPKHLRHLELILQYLEQLK